MSWFAALYHGTLLISEACVIWYLVKYRPGQRVIDWLFRKGKR